MKAVDDFYYGWASMTSPRMRKYERSQLNWPMLQRYAADVARKTKTPRETIKVAVKETRTREVRAGFLGRSTRRESYTVDVEKAQQVDHWTLETRYWISKEKGSHLPYLLEEDRWFTHYCLGVDGRLFILQNHIVEVYPRQGPMIVNEESSRRPMEESDALILDFEPKCHSSKGDFSVESTRDPDQSKPKFDTKGDGLTKALNDLLVRR